MAEYAYHKHERIEDAKWLDPKMRGEVHKNVCDGVYVHLSVCMWLF